RIEHRQLSLIAVERECLRIRIVGAFTAKRRVPGAWLVPVIHSRPLASNMSLWLLNLASQIFSMPQYADAASGFSIAEWPGPSASGTLAPTGGVMVLVFAVLGSSTGR